MSRFRQNPILTFLIHMTQTVLLRQLAYLSRVALAQSSALLVEVESAIEQSLVELARTSRQL